MEWTLMTVLNRNNYKNTVVFHLGGDLQKATES